MRRKVKLHIEENKTVTLKTETFCGGLFAVHGTYDADGIRSKTEFTLTHVPTGFAIVHNMAKAHLIRVIKGIMDLGFPWMSSKKGILQGYGKRNPEKVRKMYMVINES